MSISSRLDNTQSFFHTFMVKAGAKARRVFRMVGVGIPDHTMFRYFGLGVMRTDRISIADNPIWDCRETLESAYLKDYSFRESISLW